MTTTEGDLSTVRKMFKQRLHWGDAKDIVPPTIFTKNTPKTLRRYEKEGDISGEIGFEGRFDQSCLRFARLSAFSSFINIINIVAKVGFFASIPVSILTSIPLYLILRDDPSFHYSEILEFLLFINGAPLLVWKGTDLLITTFPKFFIRSGRGPEWEINRRTGMVKIWKYPRKIPFVKRGKPEIIEEPFTAFTPWIGISGDRHGALYRFEFFHREKDLEAFVGDALAPQKHPVMCYAYWQFLQNYMDVTKPLPDIPALEEYRHLDPVTVEYDQKTNRPERYWRDMDDETFKQKKREQFEEVMSYRGEV
ncbi:hypothetical protein ACJO2E_16025 [Marinobacter sp. M1N3S26]|uniref:hypothetical protein n=1 Tax=Marinobacter sp. M1N3S26 TaxID=3382299 RepID=UPI00387AAC1A